jgi:hypothetical protein
LTAITRSHSSTGISSHERRGSTLINEALLIKTSMVPKRSSVACTMALVESSLAISTPSPSASKPACRNAAATFSAATTSMSAVTTRAPTLANSSA